MLNHALSQLLRVSALLPPALLAAAALLPPTNCFRWFTQGFSIEFMMSNCYQGFSLEFIISYCYQGFSLEFMMSYCYQPPVSCHVTDPMDVFWPFSIIFHWLPVSSTWMYFEWCVMCSLCEVSCSDRRRIWTWGPLPPVAAHPSTHWTSTGFPWLSHQDDRRYFCL